MYKLRLADTSSRRNPLEHYGTLGIFLAALAWLGALAWMRPLAIPDEGRYVGVAWEMLRSGDWTTPTLDGLPFLHKPPLFYWVTAAAMRLFGPGDWASRMAPILSGAATVALLHSTLRRWLGKTPARTAALVLATQPLFFGGSQFANMDMLVAACISAAILFGARAAFAFEAGVERRGDLAGAYIAAALGVLAKGLIGVVLPVLVLLTWLVVLRRWRSLRSLVWLPGVPMFGVIVVPWFAAVQLKNPGFFHYFFVVQHLQRFAGSGFNSVHPFWYYAPVLLLLTVPWSGWWLANLRRPMKPGSPQAAVMSLMWIWLGAVLVFFSIPESKLIGYVLPALPPLAVWIALVVEPLIKRSKRASTLWNASVGAAAVTCVAVLTGIAVAHPKSSRPLAMALLARPGHGGVAFIDEYRYDVPFYLHDTSPIRVLSNWNAADVQQHDNWRKELGDAGSFAPRAAATRLINESAFRSDLCSGNIRWVMASVDSAKRYPYLNDAERVATDRGSALWRIDASNATLSASLHCRGVSVTATEVP